MNIFDDDKQAIHKQLYAFITKPLQDHHRAPDIDTRAPK